MKIRKEYFGYFFSCALILLGAVMASAGFSLFLVPAHIAPGGFSGFASLVTFKLREAGITFVPTGMLMLAMNVPLYILAIRRLGGRFGAFSVFGVIAFSLLIDIMARIEPGLHQLESIHKDRLLCVLYGGVLSGLGLGLIIRVGGSTGGSDMLSVVITNRFPRVSVGVVIMLVDTFVVALSIFVYGDIAPALYSFICIFLANMLVDYVQDGVRSAKAYYVISDRSDDIAESLMQKVNRGVTALHGTGMYTRKAKNVLVCIVRRAQVAELRRIVQAIDPAAFMFSTSVKEVIGEGFAREKPSAPPKKKKD